MSRPGTPAAGAAVAAGASIMAVILGCSRGPALVDVGGIVTVGGRPIGAGYVVTCVPEAGGRPSQAVTDEAGRYRLLFVPGRSGALVGRHRVTVTWPHGDGEGPRRPAGIDLPRSVASLADTPLVIDLDRSRLLDLELAAGNATP